MNPPIAAKNCETSTNPAQNESICIYYQNVRGLRTKTCDFYIATSDCDYDVIALTETGLIPSISDCEIFNLNDFVVNRCNRSVLNSKKESGGGVLVAVRSNIMSEAAVGNSIVI